MRGLRESTHGIVDLGVVLMIGIAFAGLMVISYLIWVLQDSFGLVAKPTAASSAAYNATYYAQNSTRASFGNITDGFNDAIALILVAITVFILAIAISALLLLRGR